MASDCSVSMRTSLPMVSSVCGASMLIAITSGGNSSSSPATMFIHSLVRALKLCPKIVRRTSKSSKNTWAI